MIPEQGHAKAQYNLGVIYANGEGTLTDKIQSAYWIKKSFENGYSDAKDFWDKFELWQY